MKKYIHITKADRDFIAKSLKITDRMVFKGIRFESDTKTAKKVRKLAMDRGGIAMAELPLAEMLHDSDGYMRQWLSNGAMLEISKMSDCSCDVFFRGEKVKHYDNVMVSDIPNIQDWAMSLR